MTWYRWLLAVTSAFVMGWIIWHAAAFTQTLVHAINAAHTRITVLEQKLK